jgi:hypothetical protein
MAYSRTHQVEILNLIKNKTLELALYSTNPTQADVGAEIGVAGGYARETVTFANPVQVSDGTYIANDDVISFNQASADWSAPVAYWGVRIVGGALVAYGPTKNLGVNTTRTVRTGDVFQVAIGTLKIKEMD